LAFPEKSDSRRERLKIKEITLDMANSIKTIARQCFPAATQAIDFMFKN
jgi:transposase